MMSGAVLKSQEQVKGYVLPSPKPSPGPHANGATNMYKNGYE